MTAKSTGIYAPDQSLYITLTDGNGTLVTPGSGTGTVTSMSVTTANGVSGSVATATTTPAVTLTLGAITPTTVNGNTVTTGTGTLTLGSVTLNAGAGGTLGSNAFTSTAYAPIASPTFTGSVGVGVAAIGKFTIAAPDLATSSALSIRQAADTTYGYDFRNDDGNGILRLDTVNASVVSTNPSITIKRNTGLVGIGTNAPGKQLDVVGTFRASTEVTMTSLTAASGTPNSICQNSSTKEITVNAALTCTVSSLAFKHDFVPIDQPSMPMLMAMRPGSFYYNDTARQRLGFASEYMADIDPRLADAWDGNKPKSIDQNAILAIVVKSLQELKQDNDNLRAKLGLSVSEKNS